MVNFIEDLLIGLFAVLFTVIMISLIFLFLNDILLLSRDDAAIGTMCVVAAVPFIAILGAKLRGRF